MRRLLVPFCVTLTSVLLCIVGCSNSSKPTIGNLVGKCKGNFSFASSTLSLLSNGKYSQTITLNKGKSWKTSGKWRLYNNGDDRIEFTEFLFADDAGGTIAPRVAKTTFNASLDIYTGGADIIMNGDLNQFYTRTQSP